MTIKFPPVLEDDFYERRAKLTYLADALRLVGGAWTISLSPQEAEDLMKFSSEEGRCWKRETE